MVFVFGSCWAACAQGSAEQSPLGPEGLFFGGGGRPSLAREVKPVARHQGDLLWAGQESNGYRPYPVAPDTENGCQEGGPIFSAIALS